MTISPEARELANEIASKCHSHGGEECEWREFKQEECAKIIQDYIDQRAAEARRGALEEAANLFRASAAQSASGLPGDVVRLVIAAREIAFGDDRSATAFKELDAASEAFADRIHWEDEPGEFMPDEENSTVIGQNNG